MERLASLSARLCAVIMLVAVYAEDGQLRGHWQYFPVPAGTPAERLPPEEELLKIVPPLRATPRFSAEAETLGLAVWWGDYSQMLFGEQPPAATDVARRPVLRTPPGEDEPLILGLWGINHTGAVTLKLKQSPFPVTVRRVEFAPRYLPTPYRGVQVDGGRVVHFATYLPETGTADVRPGENTVFWINVDVPDDAEPGDHAITFDLVVHQVRAISLTATVRVLPFAVPRADIAYGMYFRPYEKYLPARYRTPGLMQAYWRDMARHGMTSATLYNYAGRVHDAAGDAAFDGNADIDRLKEWLDVGLVHRDIPIMFLGAINTAAAGTVTSEVKRRGFPEFLMYGPDEPSVDDEARAAFEALQPLRRHLRITTAINDHAATAYADLIDVWVVNAGRITPELRQLATAKGTELWTYDCTHRGRGNGTRARFYAGLYTWALGLRGNFHWCYTGGYSWEGDRNAIFCFVLPSDSGPVPSVAWENRREGVEDYRLLRLLEARIAARPFVGEAPEAKEWLADLRSRVRWDLIQGMPKSVYPWDGAEVHPMCPDFAPSELAGIRNRVVEYILALE
jgi:hypothetical protein